MLQKLRQLSIVMLMLDVDSTVKEREAVLSVKHPLYE